MGFKATADKKYLSKNWILLIIKIIIVNETYKNLKYFYYKEHRYIY